MKKLTTKNKIALIIGMHYAWFWVPIWVLFYRRFTDYSGVAFLEALSMFCSMAMIVPGGLIADYFGRKRVLIIAQMIVALSALFIGYASSFSTLAIGIACMSLAAGLFLSSIEAFLYDYLKAQRQEETYNAVWGRMVMIRMLSSAAASLVGGVLYSIDVRLPWIALSSISLLSCGIAWTLKDTRLETAHDSFPQFLKEAVQGSSELFKKNAWMISIPLLLIGIFFTVDSSGIWDIQAVEFHFSSQSLGILLTITYLVAAFISWYGSKISQRLVGFEKIVCLALVWGILWFVSGLVTGIIGGGLLVLRTMVSVLADNQSSVLWNKMIQSKVRATTLSVITIIRGIPYIIVASYIGVIIDTVGIQTLIRSLSLGVVGITIVTGIFWIKKRGTITR
jgi:MFS family permease